MSRSRNRRSIRGLAPHYEESTTLALSPTPLVFSPAGTLTILVIDDNTLVNEMIATVLMEQGYHVQVATSAGQAMELIAQAPPNLVLVDALLPQSDNYGLLNRIHGNPSTRDIPVIWMTGHDSPDFRRRMRVAGGVDYLTKPIHRDELVAAVAAALRRQEERDVEICRRVDEMRRQIIAMVQHEFRTPLTFVMGYAEFLQDGLQQNLPREELENSVSAILEGSHRLHRLVESFLLLAMLSEDRLPDDEIYPLDPTALWRECITEATLSLHEAQLQVIIAEPPDPVIVFGVMDLLREALTRLLDNAIRYRRPDSRYVWLDTVVKPGLVGWRIRDEGMGVSPTRLATLSSPFVRGHAYQSDQHGMGLGLALARRVAELHHGYLEIESQEGVGSTFILWVSDRELI